LLRLGISGVAGKMGRALVQAIFETKDLRLGVAFESASSPVIGMDAGEFAGVGKLDVKVGELKNGDLSQTDIIIDFSIPEATLALAELCKSQDKGMVIGTTGFEKDQLKSDLLEIAPKILEFSQPVWLKIDQFKKQKKKILFEGAQGILLDVDHGTYPFVTSSNTVASSAATGTGCGPNSINYVLGITKAYTTRVGEGPFPTELTDDVGELLGTRGKEFGTVTSRKRRCGWFDGVLVRQTIKVSGIDGIALT